MRFLTVFLALGLGVAALGCSEDAEDDGTDSGGAGGEGEGGAGGAADGSGGGVGPTDAAIVDAAPRVECNDGADNDEDELIDYPRDPGCQGATDRTEAPNPACSDGEDQDGDGFTDFPDDPGCASAGDDAEENPPVDPQCNDGIDNERDGLVDEQDPGCASVADPSETDPEVPPQCSNTLDDDADGVIDFPQEPGCNTAGDDDEADPTPLPACANGEDDDDDGRVDYPDDPGCAGVGDREEGDKAVTPPCADQQDNDRDGRIDFPDDDGCVASSDYSERGSCGETYDPPRLTDGQTIVVDSSGGLFASEGSCGGRGSPELVFLYRLDRNVESLDITTAGDGTAVPTTLYVRRGACLDPESEIACQREERDVEMPGHTLSVRRPQRGDYYVFVDGVAGAGGAVELTINEVALAECLNGIDDDENGRVDYPSDPGCLEPGDRDESPPPEPPVCSNDEDDDRDGLTDYPLDFGCISAASDDETDRCGQGVRFQQFPPDQDFVLGNSRRMGGMGTSSLAGSCGGQNNPEVIYHYHNPFNARLTFTTAHEETEIPTVLYVRSDCDRPQAEMACDAGDIGGTMRGRVTVDRAPVGDLWVVVDTRFGQGGPFKLSVTVTRLDPGCSDGRDNDGDGEVDGDDPGCEDAEDEDERDPPQNARPAACRNGEDDDGDGLTDYPLDPGCAARGQDDETDPEEDPACSNGVDDDEDNIVDFPVDPGCQATGDRNERNPVPAPQCGDRQDNDQDGITDYPLDPGCQAAGDPTEVDPQVRPICSNGVDDDRDGIADFPFDVGCRAAAWADETDPEVLPGCSNDLDDDEDGDPDFPRDYGCTYAADEDEAGAAFRPQCANRMDDDGDGRSDFPDDPGCRFAADADEINPGRLPPRCNDGVDNDLDDLIDFQDLGCLDSGDNEESDDPELTPACGNDVDDDEDDLPDWPEDPGCQARGDLTEDQSCRAEVETPLLAANGRVRGSTTEDGPDLYYTRCGGRQAPEAVYRYVLEAAGDLTFSAANPGTDFPVVISVRNDCEEPESLQACAGNFANPEPTVTLRGAEPGEYFVFLDGGGPERYVSAGGQIAMPADPSGYVANQADLGSFGQQCWSDGGGDAFDCYGNITVSAGGGLVAVPVAPGEGELQAGGYSFRYESSFAHANVWRMILEPAEDFDETPVTVTIIGNMGCDRDCVDPRDVEFNGRTVNYFSTTDEFDPDSVQLLLPSDPEELGQVRYENQNDNVTITATEIKLPATFYMALGNAAQADVIDALLADIELQAGPGGNDAPRFGSFELTAVEAR